MQHCWKLLLTVNYESTEDVCVQYSIGISKHLKVGVWGRGRGGEQESEHAELRSCEACFPGKF